MDIKTHLLLSKKILEMCDRDSNAIIYSTIPMIDYNPSHFKRIYAHSIGNLPKLIDNSISILANNRKGNKNSYEYNRIFEEKENLFKNLKDLMINNKVSNNKIDVALSMISHLYLDVFFHPIQFFLPHSSHCSGKWEFWNEINYLDFRDKFNDKNIQIKFRENILKNNIWNIKFKAEEFPLIVKRRLLKEGKLDKKLNPESMIKAIIIRMGELAVPNVNYEIIDFVIRGFFTYLQIKKYKRVDREMKFLRRFENEVVKEIKDLLT